MDVTRDDHVQHALDYIQDNLPVGEQGMHDNDVTVYFKSCSYSIDKKGNQISTKYKMSKKGTFKGNEQSGTL